VNPETWYGRAGIRGFSLRNHFLGAFKGETELTPRRSRPTVVSAASSTATSVARLLPAKAGATAQQRRLFNSTTTTSVGGSSGVATADGGFGFVARNEADGFLSQKVSNYTFQRIPSLFFFSLFLSIL
jgi:hypothetical protein